MNEKEIMSLAGISERDYRMMRVRTLADRDEETLQRFVSEMIFSRLRDCESYSRVLVLNDYSRLIVSEGDIEMADILLTSYNAMLRIDEIVDGERQKVYSASEIDPTNGKNQDVVIGSFKHDFGVEISVTYYGKKGLALLLQGDIYLIDRKPVARDETNIKSVLESITAGMRNSRS